MHGCIKVSKNLHCLAQHILICKKVFYVALSTGNGHKVETKQTAYFHFSMGLGFWQKNTQNV